MKLRSMGAVGAGAIGLTMVSAASPAMAAPDCGAVPAGATLTIVFGDTCQLDFATPGTSNWTVPAGAQGLQALVLGAGGGALWDGAGTGYAGNAGELRYVDYSATAPGAPVVVVVGDGGVTGNSLIGPTSGEVSSVEVSGVLTDVDGGVASILSYCFPEGEFSVASGNGYGAAGLAPIGGNCEDGYAPGITPSVDAVDSFANPTPAIFDEIATTFGIGGRVLITADTLPADAELDGLGIGAHVRYDSTLNQVVSANATAGSGRVILRYSIASALAATGVEAVGGLTIAAIAAGLGAVLLAASRRRTTA